MGLSESVTFPAITSMLAQWAPLQVGLVRSLEFLLKVLEKFAKESTNWLKSVHILIQNGSYLEKLFRYQIYYFIIVFL